MKVSIDERHAGLPGIGRFATELAAGLVRRAGPGDQILSLRPARPKGWLGSESLSARPSTTARAGRAIPVLSPTVGPLEQVELAFLLRLHRVGLHHSTHLSLPRLAGVPVVLTVHDLFPLTESGHARSGWAGAYYRTALPWAVEHADAVVAVSNYTAQQLEAVLGRRPDAVIGHGVDHSAWRCTAPAPPVDGGDNAPRRGDGARSPIPYLLYVGTAKRHKNLTTLLAAHAGARDRQGGGLPPLVLAGPTVADIQALGQPISEAVTVLGRVPDRDLPELYRGALAVAVPSLYEGFGLTALEAMAHGVPVVAADSPGLRDTVGDAAALVPATDPGAWADALARTVGDAQLRRMLVERGRLHAAGFRWDDSADAYLSLYRQVLGR